jgi:hypothetical protein
VYMYVYMCMCVCVCVVMRVTECRHPEALPVSVCSDVGGFNS